MEKLNYQGLVFETSCKYFYIHTGETYALRENKKTSVYEIIFPEGATSDEVSRILGISREGASQILRGMTRPEKFNPVTVTLNGLKFRKLTYDQHIIKIVIVQDSDSRVIQGYSHTTLVVSEKDYKNQEFIEFLLCSGGLKYIVPEITKKCLHKQGGWEIRNFPRIIIGNKSVELVSDSETIYTLRAKYDNYRIRSIDYQNQFVEEIRKRLGDYGIELARYNREKTLANTSYVTYRFSQTPIKANHPLYSDHHCTILNHRVPVEFELRCDNTQLFFDFKNKYNNVDLLTNFCEMATMDRYGSLWVSAIKWGRITEDFSQTYESDNNANFALQCQFTCELYFYEAYDDHYGFIEEINLELKEENMYHEEADKTITTI